MIKRILGLAVIALIAIVGYNYFLGDAQEKESSRKIVAGVKDLGKSVGAVGKNTVEKLTERKMDNILDDLGTAVTRIQEKGEQSSAIKDSANKLRDMLKLLQEEVKIAKMEKGTEGKERRSLRKKIDHLESEVYKLAERAGVPMGEE